MNLSRMRDFGWTEYVTPIMLRWKLYIPWGDQVSIFYIVDSIFKIICLCLMLFFMVCNGVKSQ